MKRNDCPEISTYCVCGCTRLVATRYDWDSENPDYEVSMESSNIRHNCNSFWQRIVDAVRILEGERPTYADVCFESKDEFKRWVDGCVDILK